MMNFVSCGYETTLFLMFFRNEGQIFLVGEPVGWYAGVRPARRESASHIRGMSEGGHSTA